MFYILIFIFVVYILVRTIKVASHQERFAVIRLGQFKGFKGPGLHLRFFGHWTRLRLGDRGELVSPEIGRFHGKAIPLLVDSNVRIGSMIRITDFEENRVVGTLDPEERRTFTCKKCGHENII